MKRYLLLFGVAAALAMGATTLLRAQAAPAWNAPRTTADPALNESTDLWFVELASPPSVDGTSESTLKAERAAFRRAAGRARLAFRERYAFDKLWNGLSVRIDPRDARTLQTLPGVKAVYPVVRVSLPRPEPGVGSALDLVTATSMTGADVVQNLLGLQGDGIKVGIIDSGVDYNHPDLGGCFGTGCRVAQGYDFVGDAYNADPTSASYNPVAVPDPDPDDCEGHGTHVSGIVGANGVLTGVAPHVTFGAYRVFGCEGSTESDIMVLAMERALADGMDVVNMSIGSPFQWPQYPTAQAADRLVKKGVVVVASAGNNGTNGLYATGAPGTGTRVISVASIDNVSQTLPYFEVDPDAAKVGYNAATGAPPPPTSGSMPLARTGTSSSTADACSRLPAGSLAGQVALIRRGTCSFYQKAFNAQAAGAAGVVLYNNVSGRISPTVAGSPAITIPVVAVSDTEGLLINGRLAGGAVNLTWTSEVTQFVQTTGGLISSFSSWGPSPTLDIKPDISAPGGSIFSTYPLELGGYANLSGTSMSSPHVAGAVALLLQARPGTKPADVRALLQNTADPHLWGGNPALGLMDSVHRQGAGMLDIPGAVLSSGMVTPSKIALGESEHGAATVKLRIRNGSNRAVKYVLSDLPAISTGPNTFTPSFQYAPASVSFSAPIVRVPAHGQASVEVTIDAPAFANRSFYGGYVVLTPKGGGPVLRVPYGGFKGDYQSITALTPTANNFPWLTLLYDGSFYKLADNDWAFSFVDGDMPYILVHLDHQVQQLYVDVLDATTDQPIDPQFSRGFDLLYVGRNTTSTGFFALDWNGRRIVNAAGDTAPVPDGSYRLRLRALKALGDPNNPAHWETWTSPIFGIARP